MRVRYSACAILLSYLLRVDSFKLPSTPAQNLLIDDWLISIRRCVEVSDFVMLEIRQERPSPEQIFIQGPSSDTRARIC